MKPDTIELEKIAVIGGGITGIAAALELAASQRFRITLFEKEDRLGGLSSSYHWQDGECDRFYHVILPSDFRLIGFLKELGLESRVIWRQSKSGFYGAKGLTSFASASDFLRFPYLSLLQKIRLGLGILRTSRIKDLSDVDGLFVEEWLLKMFGAGIYGNFWESLLRSKLGAAKDRTSAALMAAIIQRLYAARSSADKQERMGHVHGGYKTVWEAARSRLTELGVTVCMLSPVLAAVPAGRGQGIDVSTPAGWAGRFDRMLFTIPCPEVVKTLADKTHPYWDKIGRVDYIGVVCVLLILRRSLSPYYVINLLDRDLPFTGIIESTNVIPPQELENKTIVYLPKYLAWDDPLLRSSDREIVHLFLNKLRVIFPGMKEEDILHTAVFREPYTQPVQEPHRLADPVDVCTPLPRIYLANTSMILNSTLNNDAAVSVARKAVEIILSAGGQNG